MNITFLKFLKGIGLLRPPTDDRVREVCAGLLLESSLAINLVRIRTVNELKGEENDTEAVRIAEFLWTSIAVIIDINGEATTLVSMLYCEVDLTNNRAVKAHFRTSS